MSRNFFEPCHALPQLGGANCMLEYKLDEAIELLRTNESNARTTLKSLEEELLAAMGTVGVGGAWRHLETILQFDTSTHFDTLWV